MSRYDNYVSWKLDMIYDNHYEFLMMNWYWKYCKEAMQRRHLTVASTEFPSLNMKNEVNNWIFSIIFFLFYLNSKSFSTQLI